MPSSCVPLASTYEVVKLPSLVVLVSVIGGMKSHSNDSIRTKNYCQCKMFRRKRFSYLGCKNQYRLRQLAIIICVSPSKSFWYSYLRQHKHSRKSIPDKKIILHPPYLAFPPQSPNKYHHTSHEFSSYTFHYGIVSAMAVAASANHRFGIICCWLLSHRSPAELPRRRRTMTERIRSRRSCSTPIERKLVPHSNGLFRVWLRLWPWIDSIAQMVPFDMTLLTVW